MYLLHWKFIFVFLAHLHLFNNWLYDIFSNNARDFNFKINLGWRSLIPKLIGNLAGKNIAIINDFDLYKLSIYLNRWKNDNKENVFSTAMKNWILCWCRWMGRLFVKIQLFYVLISLPFYIFKISLKYR